MKFLHVDDCADALVHLMKTYSDEAHINVGSGSDLSIRELAELVRRVVGYQGEIVTDPSKPDGTPRKLMDVSRLADKGWKARISLDEGVRGVYRWYCDHLPVSSGR